MLLFTHDPAALGQTNENGTPVSAPLQIWDYAAELKFSDEQREAMEGLRDDYNTARSALRRSNESEAPPDVKQRARTAFAEQFRAINSRVGTVLSAEQKQQFAELQAKRRHRTSSMAKGQDDKVTSADKAEADDDLEERSHFTHLPLRQQLTEEEYGQLAAELRKAYTKEPRQWPAPTIDDSVKSHFVELGLLPTVQYPTNNPYSDAKAELGKKLFFDPRLSESGQIACANCHDAELGWSDGRTVSFGHSRTPLKRNSPTLLNIGHNQHFFWDGRATSLEAQAIEVVNNPDEMRGSAQVTRDRLGKISGYTNAFAEVFGTPDVTLPRVGLAIATFERTITSRSNPFDSFLRGNTNALSDSAVRGLHLFRTTARCINCHQGPNFTDNRFHDEGLSYFGRNLQDLGRYEVTRKTADVGTFKTPTLRNIARTAPYMHNGLFDLDGVLNLYNVGMPTLRPKADQKEDLLFPTKSPLLKPLGLNKQDLQDLKSFLESLTESRHRVPPPELP